MNKKPYWITEHFTEGYGWTSVMKFATELNLNFAFADVEAYVHWWPHQNGKELLLNDYGELTPKAYVLGQFSKFIKPGFVRVETKSDNNNVLVSAYIGQNNKVKNILKNFKKIN
jgi:glucuronoarabinoxylan endo-1,4-beta-xylanase